MEKELEFRREAHGTFTVRYDGVVLKELDIDKAEQLRDYLQRWITDYKVWTAFNKHYQGYSKEVIEERLSDDNKKYVYDTAVVLAVMYQYNLTPETKPKVFDIISDEYFATFNRDIRTKLKMSHKESVIFFEGDDREEQINFLWFVYEKYIKPTLDEIVNGTKVE